MEYALIEIMTSEAAHYGDAPVFHAVLQALRERRIAARVHVYHGIAGAYEGGEVATTQILDLSANLPVKIEILLPAPEAEQILPLLGEIVTDGVIGVRPLDVRYHRSESRLLPRDLRVSDIMTPSPVAAHPDQPLLEVVRLLMTRAFRGLPVVTADGKVAGIVTEEDLVVRAQLPVRPGLLARLGADPRADALAGMAVRDIMTSPVDTIEGSAFVRQAVQQMVRRRHRSLPVVDVAGRLIGMCSRVDILRAAGHWRDRLACWEGTELTLSESATVADALTGKDRWVEPGAPLLEVARLLTESGGPRVAVVDGERNLLGIVTEQDLLRTLEPQHAGLLAYFARQQALPALATQTAESAMTHDPVAADVHDTLGTAVDLMARHQLKELPVVDGAGRFVGFISRLSLMGAMVGN